MAIAYDTSSTASGTGTTLTKSYTAASGSPLTVVLWVGSSDTNNFSSITADGTNMTQVGSQVFQARYFRYFYILGKSGTFDIVATNTGSGDTYQALYIASYTGVNQTGQPDSVMTSPPATASATSVSGSSTSVAANAWYIGGVGSQGYDWSSITGGASTNTIRATSTAYGVWDSGVITSAGSNTFTANFTGSTNHCIWVASFSPSTSSASSSPSTSPSSSASTSPSSSPSSSPSASPSAGYKNYTRYHYAALPGNDTDLTTTYSAQDITDVSTDDGTRVSQLATGEYAIHQYKDYATPYNYAVFLWNGQTNIPCSTSTVYLQIYNRNTTTWDTIDSDSTTGANTDFDLTATVSSLTNYKDGNSVVACRVYQLAQ